MSRVKVVLGSAHSKSTPGKRSPDGVFREYRYSREICERIQEELIIKGIDCFIDIVDDEEQSLQNRCNIVNKFCDRYGAGNVIYVSIHNNAASSSGWYKARGWEAYTTPGVTKSDKLCECLYAAAEECLKGHKIRRDMTDGDSDKEANFYVIKHTKCPAVLTENLFQDNKEDVAFLLSEEGKQAIVDLHVNGIIAYIENN